MSKGWAGGSTWRWRRQRTQIIARDTALGYHCRTHEEQGADGLNHCDRARAKPHTCTHRPEHAHHIHGRAIMGDDPRHIITACRACNLAIGDPTQKGIDPPARIVRQW